MKLSVAPSRLLLPRTDRLVYFRSLKNSDEHKILNRFSLPSNSKDCLCSQVLDVSRYRVSSGHTLKTSSYTTRYIPSRRQGNGASHKLTLSGLSSRGSVSSRWYPRLNSSEECQTFRAFDRINRTFFGTSNSLVWDGHQGRHPVTSLHYSC
jgi:hypothetical protein